MPQNDHIEQFQKQEGKRFDFVAQKRKREGRAPHEEAKRSRSLRGMKAKVHNKERYQEKANMRKQIKTFEGQTVKSKNPGDVPTGAVPAYLLDREGENKAKILSNSIKQKRKEKAGRWQVPLPKVRPMTEEEMFRVVKTGKRQKKQWKRLINKVSFVGESFVRKPPKFERFIRPSGLRFKKAHVTHPELKTTFFLDLIGVKKNPQSALYTGLGIITKGTVIEVNVSELGLVTPSGKVIWGKYAQVTNNPENDGCINAVLLV